MKASSRAIMVNIALLLTCNGCRLHKPVQHCAHALVPLGGGRDILQPSTGEMEVLRLLLLVLQLPVHVTNSTISSSSCTVLLSA